MAACEGSEVATDQLGEWMLLEVDRLVLQNIPAVAAAWSINISHCNVGLQHVKCEMLPRFNQQAPAV